MPQSCCTLPILPIAIAKADSASGLFFLCGKFSWLSANTNVNVCGPLPEVMTACVLSLFGAVPCHVCELMTDSAVFIYPDLLPSSRMYSPLHDPFRKVVFLPPEDQLRAASFLNLLLCLFMLELLGANCTNRD